MKINKKSLVVLSISLLVLIVSLTANSQNPSFPLKYSNNKRYFTDQNGTPFLYNADTGWQLFIKLTTEEAREYLIVRKKQGFNTIQTQLAMWLNTNNRYGKYIFDGNHDFSRPNEDFHNHVLKVIHIADSLGLLITMSQPWIGCCQEAFGGRTDKPVKINGPEKNRSYGRYLGKKFASCKNLFWIVGGDSDPKDDLIEIEAFAEGLEETAVPHQLLTYHANTTHSSTDIFQHAKWLGFSMVYTYWKDKPVDWFIREQMPEVYEVSLKEYNKSTIMPFVLGEAQYEGISGNDAGTCDIIRRQFYWTILSGGCGHAYGSQIWNFPDNWREILKWPGAQQIQYAYNFFNTIKWWQLIPDQKHNFIIQGYGSFSKTDYVTAALSGDKKQAALYMYKKSIILADLQQLTGNKIAVQWYNPRNGKYIMEGIFAPGKIHFNSPTDEDWVLLFNAE